MEDETLFAGPISADALYLTIWKAEQEFNKQRWSVTTFFMSVSFAIFGFSFQQNLPLYSTLALRIVALFIYWFSYILYQHFYKYTTYLRNYLLEMEKVKQTALNVQSKVGIGPGTKRPLATSGLLICFGLIFTGSVGLLFLFKL